MPARAGRLLTVEFGGDSPTDAIEGVREKSLELNGEPINVTDDDDNGYQTLLNVSQEDSVTINISGVTKSTKLKEHWFNRTRRQILTFTYPDGSTLSGQFYMSSYSESDPYNDASTFDATFMSAAQITFTP